MKKKNRITLSASSIKQFLDCSWLFFVTRMLKLPDHTHPKTHVGSLAHAILEAFCKPRHRKHYEATIHHQSVYGSPAIKRMIRMFRDKHPDVTDEHMEDLDALIFVALNHDWSCKDAVKILPPEYPFEIDFGAFAIKGFMDRVILYKHGAIIRDYKSQSKKFSDDDLQNQLQAFMYQTAVKHEFGLSAVVEFLLLRFPPNRRDPSRYLQVVEPLSDAQIEGFKVYLSHLNEAINALTEETATDNLKSQHDYGFCTRVCSLKDPFDYWVLLGEGDTPLASTRVPKYGLPEEQDPNRWAFDQLAPKSGQRVQKRRYNGCPGFYDPVSGRPRNFN